MFRPLILAFLLLGIVILPTISESSTLIDDGDLHIESEKQAAVLLTLPEAVLLVKENSPRLKSAGLYIEAAKAAVTQAGVIPNPELSYESENYEGSGPYQGGKLAEDTIIISQQLEIGGKRGGRIQVAEADADVARIEAELTNFAVMAEVVTRFVNALANQLRLQNAKDLFELAQKLSIAATARVEAGKEPPFYAINANATLFASKADYERAKNEFILSRRRLAALWGSDIAKFNRLLGNIESFTRPPNHKDLVDGIENYPQARRNALIVKNAKAEAKLQASKRWPDITVSIGERKFREGDERSYVAGVAMAIPLFNRNQGAYRGAQIQVQQAGELFKSADLDFRLEMENRLSDLCTTYQELEAFRNAGLFAVKEAMKAATEGYREGKLSYLEALNARQALADAQSRYINTLERYHVLRVRLDELRGVDIEQAGSWLIKRRNK